MNPIFTQKCFYIGVVFKNISHVCAQWTLILFIISGMVRPFRILSWGYKRILSDKMRQVFGHPKKQKRLMIKMDVQCSLSVSKYLRLPCSKACKFSYLLLCTYSIFTQIESWANFCGFPGNPPFLGPPSSRWYLHKAVDFVVLCRKTVPMIIRHE